MTGECTQCGRTVEVPGPASCCGRMSVTRVVCNDCRTAHNFPQYHLIVDGVDQWLPLHQAGATYDSGWMPVELGQWVIEKPGAVPRRMTNEDRNAIREAADRYSESK